MTQYRNITALTLSDRGCCRTPCPPASPPVLHSGRAPSPVDCIPMNPPPGWGVLQLLILNIIGINITPVQYSTNVYTCFYLSLKELDSGRQQLVTLGRHILLLRISGCRKICNTLSSLLPGEGGESWLGRDITFLLYRGEALCS